MSVARKGFLHRQFAHALCSLIKISVLSLKRRERERERERQTDRQTETERETERDRETDRQTDRQDRQKQRQDRDRQTDRQRQRERVFQQKITHDGWTANQTFFTSDFDEVLCLTLE